MNRLEVLDGYDILDTPPEQGFDDVVALAMQICDTPTALISFVAADRQWFKARVGFSASETDLGRSVCRHGLASADLLVIPDLSADPRTRDNPLVAGEPHIRFYAGAPLRTGEGVALGMLCVIDGQARPGGLNVAQAAALRTLASQVVAQLELRRAVTLLEKQNVWQARERARFWEMSPDLLVVLDFDGIFRRVNPSWSTILGYAEDEVVGRRVDSLIHPDDILLTEEALAKAAGGPLPVVENRYRHKDGGYRWVSWITPPPDSGLIYATGRHITAEKERAAQLRLFANIVESDASPVVVWGVDRRLVAFNAAHSAAYKRVYGIDQQVGDSLLDPFLPEQAQAVERFMDRALAGETFIVEVEFGDPARERPTWEISYNPLRDESEKVIGAFHRVRDITAERNAAAELARTQEALRQSQKMEAVGQLTGGLAHDFNNMLTAVTGGLDLLKVRIDRGQFQQIDRYVDMAQTGARRAAALTQRLLAFSRRQTLAPRAINVDQLVTGIAEIIDRTLGPSIETNVIGTPGLWPVLVDAPQLENALLNLCINARDAMPNGGRLTIETGNKPLDVRAAAEQDLPPGEYVSLCVSDTGAGMPPEVIERIFDPFFTTKPIGEGTGLGLSMIYGFTRQSGGQVRVYSEVGRGTTLCLYLPRHVGDLDAAPVPDHRDTQQRADAGKTILIVEDEVAIRALMDEVLTEAGYRVLEASNGPAGIKILRGGEQIDLLITDVGLPGGLNGRQVADAGRVIRPDLKVLFVTGYAANAAVGAGHLDAGMALLTKPFNVVELAQRVHAMLKAAAGSL